MLVRSLRSALAQQAAAFEIIVVDDGSGQGVETARAIGGDGVFTLETGGFGQVPARNLGIRHARGRWIAFLDDDDWWASTDYLEAMAASLGGGGLAYASGRIVYEGAGIASEAWLPFRAHVDARSVRHDNTLLVSGIAYERALHGAVGPFDETLPVYWDWDFYLRLAAAETRFADCGNDGVRISTRVDSVSAPANEVGRRSELARLCHKHGLEGVTLKNHEGIAIEQRGDGGVEVR